MIWDVVFGIVSGLLEVLGDLLFHRPSKSEKNDSGESTEDDLSAGEDQ
jgi:hypothetical protein